MNKFIKILIKSFLSVIFIIGIIISYGLIIGGIISFWFYLIINICIALTILFVFGRKAFSKNHTPTIILILCITCLTSNLLYTYINNCFDNNIRNTYISEIIDGPGNAPFEINYYFLDPNGKEKCYTRYYLFFEFPKFNEGDIVYVEEYNGVFGVEHYHLSKQ